MEPKPLRPGDKDALDYYVKCYFGKKKLTYISSKGKVRSLNKNAEYPEKLIEDIKRKEPEGYTDSDVALILAWKIGKIKHSESERELILHADWQEALGNYNEETKTFPYAGKGLLPRYGKKSSVFLDISGIAEFLRENGGDFKRKIKENINYIETAIGKMADQKWQGIGPVYMVTLLYFVTDGECPIYDRFAARALSAIKDGKAIGESVSYSNLPDKNSENFSKAVYDRMTNYIAMLQEFNGAYRTDRKVDQALWAYGHLFPAE